MTTTYTHKSTDQLVAGDIVVDHGMRLLIDQDIDTYNSDPGRRIVYHTNARCLNVDDLAGDAFLAYFLRVDNGRWVIQGNSLATWRVEVRS